MAEGRRVLVVGDAGSQTAELTFGPVSGRCHVALTLSDGRTITADDSDYFEALLSVRRELERDGLIVCCQGSRRDVWPSGMARDMGAGLKAYALIDGRQPTPMDLVDIFRPADRSRVGTVSEQESHFLEWTAQLRRWAL